MRDVLPLPERPQIATLSPGLIDREMPLRTGSASGLGRNGC